MNTADIQSIIGARPARVTKNNDGGPAFPHVATDRSCATPGMSLCDWFAGQALAGILAGGEAPGELTVTDISDWAWRQADAMLAVRSASNLGRDER